MQQLHLTYSNWIMDNSAEGRPIDYDSNRIQKEHFSSTLCTKCTRNTKISAVNLESIAVSLLSCKCADLIKCSRNESN